MNDAQTSLHDRGWHAVLDGTAALRARQGVFEIADALVDAPAGVDATLGGGDAGLALLFAYVDRAWPTPRFADAAAARLAAAVDGVAARPMTDWLFGGFTGVAWCAQHLLHDAPAGDGDVGDEIDAALAGHLEPAGWPSELDVVNGLAGMAIYALDRLPRPDARRCLERIVAHLAARAHRDGERVYWHTPPELLRPEVRRDFPRGYVNLGVAHGVPGIAAVLARIAAAGVCADEAASLARAAFAWLRRQRRADPRDGVYPHYAAPEGDGTRSRLAWCYGDLGIALALLGAARQLGEPRWEADALELAYLAAARPLGAAGAVDTGLCHGAAGIAHLWNRLYQATGEATFGGAARRWYARTLEMRHDGRGVAAWPAWTRRANGENGYEPHGGLVVGAAGVALALLAAVTPVEPAWDRVLLADVR